MVPSITIENLQNMVFLPLRDVLVSYTFGIDTNNKNLVSGKVVLNKVGHLLVCKQSKRVWETPKNYQPIVMSQLYENKTPWL